MDRKSLVGRPGFRDGINASLEVCRLQTRYTALLHGLGRIGTEVSRDQRQIHIPRKNPYTFFLGGGHEFVFPAQPDAEWIESDDSGVVPGTRPNTQTNRSGIAIFDPTLVTGILAVAYSDAYSAGRPELVLRDRMGSGPSVVPDEVHVLTRVIFT